MERYGSHDEQTYRNNFGKKKSECIDWLKLNVSLAKRYFGEKGRHAIAIDPSFISKSGKKTPHIGRFWSGCAQAVKHGLEIMGKCKIRLVIWQMLNGKKKLFFSNDISLSGEEVLAYYRSRFQIEFCYRDAKGYTGLIHCQARNKWKLDFAFNASFASLNVAKVTMKEIGMEYSMSSFKALMTNTYIVRRIFKACGYNPNRTLISKIFKDLSCLQRKTA